MADTERPRPSSGKPSFRRPPVVETALSIQFNELDRFKTVHFGLFHTAIRDRYPVAEDRDRVALAEERFPARSLPSGFRISSAAPVGRVFFLNAENGGELIQLQPDRFGFNWRILSGDTSDGGYPRFSANSLKCLNDFSNFVEFCRGHALGDVVPNMCEVVYVNHIFPQPGESIPGLFETVFSLPGRGQAALCLGDPENITFNRTYEIGDRAGRLYAEASTGAHPKRGAMIVLKMTGRVFCQLGESPSGPLALAHDWVVDGFVDITDETIRKERWQQIS